MREARLGELLQVLAPGGHARVEGGELALVAGRDGAVGDAEVAYVQLVDRDVLGRTHVVWLFTNWLRRLFIERLTEYGSVTSFVTIEFVAYEKTRSEIV